MNEDSSLLSVPSKILRISPGFMSSSGMHLIPWESHSAVDRESTFPSTINNENVFPKMCTLLGFSIKEGLMWFLGRCHGDGFVIRNESLIIKICLINKNLIGKIVSNLTYINPDIILLIIKNIDDKERMIRNIIIRSKHNRKIHPEENLYLRNRLNQELNKL